MCLQQTEFRLRKHFDTHGKTQIDSLIGTNLRISNNRTSWDSFGYFTLNKNGQYSVNDYGIVNEYLFNEVDNFVVFPQLFFGLF